MLVNGLDNNPHFPQFAPIQGWNLGEEAFQKASLRFLFVFPSPMGLRSVSASHITLYGILKSTFGDDIFVDLWMEPNAYDRSYMDKNFPQKIIGFFSHHTWEDFDIIGCSCLPEGTLVATSKGWAPIQDLKAGDIVLQGKRKNTVTAVLNTGLKRVYNIYAQGKPVYKCSAEHMTPVFRNGVIQEVPGSEIREGDYLLQSTECCFGDVTDSNAYYKGYFVGDGWLSRTGRKFLSVQVPESDSEVISYLFPDGLEGICKYATTSNEKTTETVWEYRRNSVALWNEFVDNGFSFGAEYKRFPSVYYSWDKYTACAFIRGLMDADGWSYFDSDGEPCIGLKTVSPSLAEDLQKALLNLGINSSISVSYYDDYVTSPVTGKLIHRNNTYTVLVAKHSVPLYLKLIGSSLKRKQIAYDKVVPAKHDYVLGVKAILASYWNSDNSDFKAVVRTLPDSLRKKIQGSNSYELIRSDNIEPLLPFLSSEDKAKIEELCLYHYCLVTHVEVTEPVPMYDIMVDGNHLFNAEGYITHNCAITMMEPLQMIKDLHDAGFPVWYKDRKNDDKTPLLTMGGVAADQTAATDNIVDFSQIGMGERTLPLICRTALEAQAKFGSVAKGKEWITAQVQDHPGIYNPRRYRYDHKIVNGRFESDYLGLVEGDTGSLQMRADTSLPPEVIKMGDNMLRLSLPGGSHHKVSLQSSIGCHGTFGTCSFCAEGWLYGSWRERSEEDYRQGIITAKKSAMADGFSWFSFNGNFLENYVQSLQDAAKYFHKIGSINIRIDSLAGSIKLNGENNYIRLLKELGTTSVACPIEGISQRMRDFLNKNLSEDDILTVDEELFKRRMIRVKHGAIFTGYEQKEDWEEHAALTDKELALRDKWNANSMIQYNFTWLVHNAGTPLFYMPRKTTAMAWKQFFSKEDGKDFYYYPYMYLSDRGIKAKESSQPKDTLIQQFLVDCPTEFLEDIWVKPMLKGEMENFSTDQVRRLRQGCEKWGINPRAQLLERDFKKHVHQHMHISTADEVINKFGDGDVLKYLEWIRNTKLNGTGCCLKTPATEWKHNQQKCFGCSSCKTVDEDAKAYGLVKKPHIAYMHNRKLQTNYNLMDIKTSLMQNTPSFYYRLIFKIGEKGRYIAKEALVRRWMSKATDYDESLIKNFRCISTALHKWLDYEDLTSTYTGYELCIMGFQNQLDLDKFKEIAKQVNAYSKDSGVQLADIQAAQESGGTSFHVLHSFEVVAEKEDFDKFIKKMCTEDRRIYEGSTSMPETFSMSIDYKILRGKRGYRVLLLCPPRFNVMWSEGLKKWTANRVMDRVIDWSVMSIFTKTSDGRLIDVLTGKPFEPAGFIHAEQTGDGFVEKGDAGVEIDGA